MSTPPPADRRVGQLRNDVDDLYDILADVQTELIRHSVTLDEHTVILGQHGETLDEHTVILAEHTTILGQHTAILGEHSTKLDHIIELLEAS